MGTVCGPITNNMLKKAKSLAGMRRCSERYYWAGQSFDPLY